MTLKTAAKDGIYTWSHLEGTEYTIGLKGLHTLSTSRPGNWKGANMMAVKLSLLFGLSVMYVECLYIAEDGKFTPMNGQVNQLADFSHYCHKEL